MVLAYCFCFIQSCLPATIPRIAIVAINNATSTPWECSTYFTLRPCCPNVLVISKVALCARSISACDCFPRESWRAIFFVATGKFFKLRAVLSTVSRSCNNRSTFFNKPAATSCWTFSWIKPFTDDTINWVWDFHKQFMSSNMCGRVFHGPRSRLITPIISCDSRTSIMVLAYCFCFIQSCLPATIPRIAIVAINNATSTPWECSTYFTLRPCCPNVLVISKVALCARSISACDCFPSKSCRARVFIAAGCFFKMFTILSTMCWICDNCSTHLNKPGATSLWTRSWWKPFTYDTINWIWYECFISGSRLHDHGPWTVWTLQFNFNATIPCSPTSRSLS